VPQQKPTPSDSLPGDLVGTDSAGNVRIDRVIPLSWALGIIGGVLILAAQQYYGQQQLIEKVADMRTEYKATAVEIRAITNALSNASTRDTEHSMLLQALERRVTQLEGRRP